MTLSELLDSRQKQLDALASEFSLCALAPGKWSLRTKSAEVDTPAIDRTQMCVPCTITTQDEDRTRDVVVTAGIDLGHHAASRTVLLNHGYGTGNIFPTIAKAEDPNGQYTVKLEAGKGRAVSWFTNKVKDSEQVFALVEEGLLKGVSIGFVIKAAEYRRDHPDDYQGWPGMLIAQSELFEYSHCPVGQNPYALADKIGKGVLAGSPISDMIIKSLSPHLPPLKQMVTGGFVPPKPEGKMANEYSNGSQGTGTNAAPPAPELTQVLASLATSQAHMAEMVKGMTEAIKALATEKAAPKKTPAQGKTTKKKAEGDKEEEEEKGEGMNEESGADGGYVDLDSNGQSKSEDDEETETKEEDPKEEPEEGESKEEDTDDMTKDWLPGAFRLSGCYERLMDLAEYVREGDKNQENDTVKSHHLQLSEMADEACSLTEECWKGAYPDTSWPFGAKAEDEHSEGDETEEKSEDGEEGEEHETEERKARRTEAENRLSARLKAFRKARKARLQQEKLTASGKLAVGKLLAFVGTLAKGNLTASHKTALAPLVTAVEAATKADAGEEKAVKELKEQNADLRKKLTKALDSLEQVRKEFRKARTGR